MSTNFLFSKVVFTEGESDRIESRLPFKIFSTLQRTLDRSTHLKSDACKYVAESWHRISSLEQIIAEQNSLWCHLVAQCGGYQMNRKQTASFVHRHHLGRWDNLFFLKVFSNIVQRNTFYADKRIVKMGFPWTILFFQFNKKTVVLWCQVSFW